MSTKKVSNRSAMAGKLKWSGDYRAEGMVRPPSTASQGKIVLAARKYLTGLKCFPGVKDLLEKGRTAQSVVQYIRDANEGTQIAKSSLATYVAAYRNFYISPLATGEGIAADRKEEPVAQVVRAVVRKLNDLERGAQELDDLTKLMASQMARIERMIANERLFLNGMVTNAGIRKEMETLRVMAETAVEIKFDLGLLQRVPRGVDLTVRRENEQHEYIKSLPEDVRQTMQELGAGLLSITSPEAAS